MSALATVLFISLLMAAAVSALTIGREKYIPQPDVKPEQKPTVPAPVQLMSEYLGLQPSAVMATRTRKRLLALPHLS